MTSAIQCSVGVKCSYFIRTLCNRAQIIHLCKHPKVEILYFSLFSRLFLFCFGTTNATTEHICYSTSTSRSPSLFMPIYMPTPLTRWYHTTLLGQFDKPSPAVNSPTYMIIGKCGDISRFRYLQQIPAVQNRRRWYCWARRQICSPSRLSIC